MGQKLSQRLQRMAPSATMAMNQKSRELQAKGIEIINFTVGEPDFFTPDHIKEKGKKAIDGNKTFYPPAQGLPGLVNAIVKKFQRENSLEYKKSEIVVTCGAKNALASAIMALVDPGDEVIVPAPYWVTYVEQVKLADGVNVIIDGKKENKYKVTAEEIEEKITPRTKLLLLCSPSNPTGAVYSYDELAAIAEMLKKYPDVFVITDEIYEHIIFEGKHYSLAQFPGMKDRVIIVNGVSKAYAMTGWRIGYLAAPEWIAKACIKLQGQLITGPATIAQEAAIEALEGDQQCVDTMRQAFKRRKELIMQLVQEIEGFDTIEPEGAFYIFPEVKSYFGKQIGDRHIKTASDLSLYLLEEAHVGTVPGEAFGNPHCIRISYATSDENIKKGMQQIKEALGKLQ